MRSELLHVAWASLSAHDADTTCMLDVGAHVWFLVNRWPISIDVARQPCVCIQDQIVTRAIPLEAYRRVILRMVPPTLLMRHNLLDRKEPHMLDSVWL